MPDYKEHLSSTEKFTGAVFDYAKNKSNKILREVQEKKRRELKCFKEILQKENRNYIKNRLHKENAKISRELAQREQELKKKILKRRTEITELVFEQAKEKLKEFTTTAEYKTLVKKQAQKAAKLFDCEDAVVLIRMKDEAIKAEIEASFGKKCDFISDDDIKIGGIQVKSQSLGIMADLSLDAMLEEEKEWFRENSGLSVIIKEG